MAISTYDQGDVPALEGRFTDSNGALVDPGPVFFRLYDRSNVVLASYTYLTDAALVRSSTGIYYVLQDTTGLNGLYGYNFYSTGTSATAGINKFRVRNLASTRVIEEEVTEICPTDLDVYPFIATAHAIVEANLLTSGLSETILIEIEKFLSAHLVCLADPRVEEEELLDNARVKFAMGTLGKGLDGTVYGQMVKALDTTGTLSNLGMQRARIVVPSRYENC